MGRYTVKQLARLSGVSVAHVASLRRDRAAQAGVHRREPLSLLRPRGTAAPAGHPVPSRARRAPAGDRQSCSTYKDPTGWPLLATASRMARPDGSKVSPTPADDRPHDRRAERRRHDGRQGPLQRLRARASRPSTEASAGRRFGGRRASGIDRAKRTGYNHAASEEWQAATGGRRRRRNGAGRALHALAIAADESGVRPSAQPASRVVARMWGRPCPPQAYAGLADLLLDHPDFARRYEGDGEGFTDWLTQRDEGLRRAVSLLSTIDPELAATLRKVCTTPTAISNWPR